MAQCHCCRSTVPALWLFSCGCRCCDACSRESLTARCPKCHASGKNFTWRLVTYEELQFGSDGAFTQWVKRVGDVLCRPEGEFDSAREHADYEERKVQLCCRLMAPGQREAAEAELAEYGRRNLQDILRWRRGEPKPREPKQPQLRVRRTTHPVLQRWFDAAPVALERRPPAPPPRPNVEQRRLQMRRAREEAFGTLSINKIG